MVKKKFRKVIKSDDNINVTTIAILIATLLIGYFFIAMFSILIATDGATIPYFAAMLSPIILSIIFSISYYYAKIDVYYEEI